ncbi:MAG: hypothetical protein ACYDAQ_04005 [Mycobacteriales bacterium]
MRGPRLRALVAVAGLLVLALASPGLAAGSQPRPQIQGPPGAWVVPSQNILTGFITVADGGVRVDLTLSAPPTPGLRTVYSVVMYAGCVPYVFEYDWNGIAALSATALRVYPCPTLVPSRATATYPATARPLGSGILFQGPFAGALRPGLRTYAVAIAESGPAMVIVGSSIAPGGSSGHFIGGDIAFGTGDFILGG